MLFLKLKIIFMRLAVFNFYSSKANLPKKIFFASPPDELILIKNVLEIIFLKKIVFPKTRNSLSSL